MAASGQGFAAELPDQADPEIGRELIRVRHDDGRIEELRLGDYERLYLLPGLYEEIVQERLGCRSPQMIAAVLAAAVDAVGSDRADTKVIDLAAGNGVSGEALAAEGLHAVLGTDVVASAREAALRDRPGVYDQYLTLDLLATAPSQRRAIAALGANALSCVAPVGPHAGQVPAPVLIGAAELLVPDALVAYMHDPGFGDPDAITTVLWDDNGFSAHELERRRYVHRRTVNGAPYDMDGVVWRLRRRPG
jgi:predicted TPR repeat methyltransferase